MWRCSGQWPIRWGGEGEGRDVDNDDVRMRQPEPGAREAARVRRRGRRGRRRNGPRLTGGVMASSRVDKWSGSEGRPPEPRGALLDRALREVLVPGEKQEKDPAGVR